MEDKKEALQELLKNCACVLTQTQEIMLFSLKKRCWLMVDFY